MRVLDVIYGGNTYHVVDRTLEELKREIADAARGAEAWLTVIDGVGPAHLLISPGVAISIIPRRGEED